MRVLDLGGSGFGFWTRMLCASRFSASKGERFRVLGRTTKRCVGTRLKSVVCAVGAARPQPRDELPPACLRRPGRRRKEPGCSPSAVTICPPRAVVEVEGLGFRTEPNTTRGRRVTRAADAAATQGETAKSTTLSDGGNPRALRPRRRA